MSYAIQAGLDAELIESVVVSTDDEEIAEVAKQWGAEVPCLRPDSLATDHATADQAVAHMVRYLSEDLGREVDVVVLIQPTSPFVNGCQIDEAVKMLADNPVLESVTTLAKLDHRLHPYNLSFVEEDESWEFVFPKEREASRTRQSKPAAYQFANLFAARSQTMLTRGRFGERKGAVVVEDVYAWDIDHEWQLKVAEAMLREGIVDPTRISQPKKRG